MWRVALLMLCGLWLAAAPATTWATASTTAVACPSWPLWERFKSLYISDDGRVIDTSTPAHITTSEGQSYAMLFALLANDRAAFAQLLQWTENNLARGDLAKNLPAWQWGRDAQDQWRVLDDNAASDADLWIAYVLSEAGRLWNEPRYTRLSRALSQVILREESAMVPGLGLALLPGPRGFVAEQSWRFNASYLPVQVLRLLARKYRPRWQGVIDSSLRIISASAPQGYAADWIEYRDATFIPDRTTQGIGGYDAIRVYLWAGTLSEKDPAYAQLKELLSPALEQFQQRERPAERIVVTTKELRGEGSPGFSAAFLPMLKAQRHPALASQLRYAEESLQDNQHYFSDVLSLFGRGAYDGWLQFAPSGQLRVKWSRSCSVR